MSDFSDDNFEPGFIKEFTYTKQGSTLENKYQIMGKFAGVTPFTLDKLIDACLRWFHFLVDPLEAIKSSNYSMFSDLIVTVYSNSF